MEIQAEILIALIPSVITLLGVVYKLGEIKADFQRQIAALQHLIDASNLTDKNTYQILKLQLDNLASSTLKEISDLEHHYQAELKSLNKRLSDVEAFLMKTSQFTHRNNAD